MQVQRFVSTIAAGDLLGLSKPRINALRGSEALVRFKDTDLEILALFGYQRFPHMFKRCERN